MSLLTAIAGAKTYRNGTLLRVDRLAIYVVRNGALIRIPNLQTLRAYGNRRVLEVSRSSLLP